MVSDQPDDTKQAFDFEAMLARCLGNRQLVERALRRFESVVQTDLKELQQATDGADAAETARIAHRLKGASSNVSALRVQAQVTELEQLALQQKVEGIPDCLQGLQKEVRHFSQCAASYWQTESVS